jgi:hypothetical protein
MKSFSVLLLANNIIADRLNPKLGVWLKQFRVVDQQL